MVPQHDLLKSFGTTTRKLKIAQTVFVLLLQIYNSFPAPDFEQKKSKEFDNFLKIVFKNDI